MYMDAAIDKLRSDGFIVNEDDVARFVRRTLPSRTRPDTFSTTPAFVAVNSTFEPPVSPTATPLLLLIQRLGQPPLWAAADKSDKLGHLPTSTAFHVEDYRCEVSRR